jgi:alpha-L-fucosidase
MTYDRLINKMGAENVFKANHNIIPPSLVSSSRMFTDNYIAELVNTRPGGKIFYTTDGSQPDENSTQYTVPFNVSETTVIKCFTRWEDEQSRVISYLIEKKAVIPSVNVFNISPGIVASIYDGRFTVLPDFSTLKPVQNKRVQKVEHTVAGKGSFFGIVFEGYIRIPEDGVYGLFINSDDGSRMILDDSEIVVNDGIHGMREEGNHYPLQKGYHKLRIEYFQGEGGIGLELLVEAPGQQKTNIPSSWLYN